MDVFRRRRSSVCVDALECGVRLVLLTRTELQTVTKSKEVRMIGWSEVRSISKTEGGRGRGRKSESDRENDL